MSKTGSRGVLGLQAKVTLVFSAISMTVALVVAAVGYMIVRDELEEQLRGTLLTTVTLGAQVLSNAEVLHLADLVHPDLEAGSAQSVVDSEEFHAISEVLNRIRNTDSQLIRFVYLVAKAPESGKGYYLADADVLKGGDGPLSLPGTSFAFDNYPVADQALKQSAPLLENDFVADTEFQVRSLSGYAPVFDRKGEPLGVLGIDMVDTDVSDALSHATQWISAVGVLALFAALLISMLMARVITRNLVSLQEVVERFGRKDYTARSEVRSRDEIGALAQSFNTMAQTIVDDQEVIASAEREAARHAESRKYLENISQGLLFTDARWIIGNQSSRYLTTMFHLSAPPEGLLLVDFLFPDRVNHVEDREQLRSYLEKLKQASSADRNRLEAENPLRNKALVLASGERLVVDARFLLLESDGQLSNVMVLFEDRTVQSTTEKVLEDERSVHEAEMEFLLALVKHGSEEFPGLIDALETVLAGPPVAATALKGLTELRSRATVLDLYGLSRDLWTYEADPTTENWGLLRTHFQHIKGFVEKANTFASAEGPDPARATFEEDWKLLSEKAHQWAQQANKSVRLVPRVDDACLSLVHELREVIDHLVRNAVTHGLETASVRIAQGKAPEGQVVVEARVTADQIHLSVSDDGTGLEMGSLRRKLASQGSSLSADAPAQQVVEALFQPGNGLGLGESAEAIRRRKGSLSVKSQRGSGATFLIRTSLTPPLR